MIQQEARLEGSGPRPAWPVIVLRTPKGWTGPREVNGVPIEGTWRSHQVPLADVRANPDHLAQLERWLRSYRPEELFDAAGMLAGPLAALPPRGERRMSASPHANGGLLMQDLRLPDFCRYAVEVSASGAGDQRADPGARRMAAGRDCGQLLDVPPVRPRPEPSPTGSPRCSRPPTARGALGRSREMTTSRRRAGYPGWRSRPPGCASRWPMPGLAARQYTREHGEDLAEIGTWTWPADR